jgi:hypothetical protein
MYGIMKHYNDQFTEYKYKTFFALRLQGKKVFYTVCFEYLIKIYSLKICILCSKLPNLGLDTNNKMRDSPIVCTYLRPEALPKLLLSTAAKRYIQTKF